ncbi:zinc metallochaperone AztD [Solicola sp. PLA-1-18]|uniref:zinc metallochaperone AztD n=1 Tax=Solicola sp. PLA-1-18 TaxID=3380532 RepID=UPI003B81F2DC
MSPLHQTAAATAVLVLAALTGCGSASDDGSGPTDAADAATSPATAPVAYTYDGGVQVLDGESLEPQGDPIALDGFNRINPAGDDRHLFVSTSAGFTLLDAAEAAMTDTTYDGAEPGHVVRHAGRTVLFTDGTGEVRVLDSDDPAGDAESIPSPEAHHGVAIELANGELVTTIGNAESRSGVRVLDEDREEIARNEQCPGVHGEATAEDETVVVGCEDGLLVYRDGELTKVQSPDAYGRIGNQAGSDESPVVLGDYKTDPDAELERPTRVSLTDTSTGELRLLDLGTTYTFRSLGRGPDGEGLVLGADGRLHVIDPETAEVTASHPVTAPWTEPIDWQQPRPALFVRGEEAFVTEPASQELHRLDLTTGEVVDTASLEHVPNEISGVVAAS